MRRSKRTRFLTDENISPWALNVMRYKRLDVIDCDAAGTRHKSDGQVFARAWKLRRVLVTHDADLLNDRLFPLRACAGLLVLPVYGKTSMEFANLLSKATSVIGRGSSLWFHTKIEVTRSRLLKVRTWDKPPGRVTEWEFLLR